MKTPYLPFGFAEQAKSDPVVRDIGKRMTWLNECCEASGLPGHIFTAALDKFRSFSDKPDTLWATLMHTPVSTEDVAKLAVSLAPLVSDEPERLDFPNAIALIDCRFITNEEWRHLRQFSIGGSDAASVLGLSPFSWGTPRGVYIKKKLGLEEPVDTDKQFIFDYGHLLEPFVIDKVCNLLGAKQYPEYRMFAHKTYPYITCNPDAILVFPDGHLALFEAKTASRFKADTWRTGIPEYYVPQPRQYLEVFDDPRLNEGYIACVYGGLPGDWKCHKYERDTVLGAEQVTKIAQFWQSYIVGSEVPPLSGTTEQRMVGVYEGGNVSAPPAASLTQEEIDKIVALEQEYSTQRKNRLATKKAVDDLKQKETEILERIRPFCPEGLTIAQCENKPTYSVSIGEVQTQKVKEEALNETTKNAIRQKMANKTTYTLSYNLPKVQVKK